ncbi:MAG: hypothetical protein ACM3S1_17035 [Hyphomicrobiales bacterium]
MTEVALDAPVRSFFERLAPLAGPEPDLPAIASLLAEFSRDTEYLAHHIDRIRDQSGAKPIHAPERGPRLQIVHRLEGQMGAVHSHKVWVAIAPIEGVETHRRYDVLERDERSARLALAEERHLGPAETVTMTPPNDVHAHGHVRGIGDPAYVLILTGDDQRRYTREQYELRDGTWRELPPGDGGDWVAR